MTTTARRPQRLRSSGRPEGTPPTGPGRWTLPSRTVTPPPRGGGSAGARPAACPWTGRSPSLGLHSPQDKRSDSFMQGLLHVYTRLSLISHGSSAREAGRTQVPGVGVDCAPLGSDPCQRGEGPHPGLLPRAAPPSWASDRGRLLLSAVHPASQEEFQPPLNVQARPRPRWGGSGSLSCNSQFGVSSAGAEAEASPVKTQVCGLLLTRPLCTHLITTQAASGGNG